MVWFSKVTNEIRVVLLLWGRFSWRRWLRSPVATVIQIGIIALGVAAIVSVRLANQSAVAGFSLFTESFTGDSDLVISSPAGRLPQAALREIRAALDLIPAHLFGVVETTAVLDASSEHAGMDNGATELTQLQVVGLDLPALQNLAYLTSDTGPSPLSVAEGDDGRVIPRRTWRMLRDGYGVFVTQTMADKLEVAADDRISVIIHDRHIELNILGILASGAFQVDIPSNVVLMDLPQLQQLTEMNGWLDRIEVRVAPGAGSIPNLAAARTALDRSAADRWIVETPDRRQDAGRTMTRAFRMNLTALSGLVLVVGLTLIVQAMRTAVARRRSEIGVLRSLGVTTRQIQWMWCAESCILGIAGSTLGVGIGVVGAHLAVGFVSRTVNALYHATTTDAAVVHPAECAAVFALGVVASVVAGIVPARTAAATPPAQVLRNPSPGIGSTSMAPTLAGLFLVGCGIALYPLPPLILDDGVRFPLAGFVVMLLWVAGMSSDLLT